MAKLLKDNKIFKSLLSRTENYALQYESTGEKCLDLFSHIGSFRSQSKKRIFNDFLEAYQENPTLTVQILFWTRAARKGAGERAVFHTIMKEIITTMVFLEFSKILVLRISIIFERSASEFHLT